MVALKTLPVWTQLRSPQFALLLVTTAFCLVRARDQPAVDVGFGSTSAAIVPGDVLLAALGITCLVEIVRRGLPRGFRLTVGGSLAFCVVLVATAAPNGAAAFVSGVKVVELAILGLGAALFVATSDRFEAIVDVLLAFTIAADLVGIVQFVANGSREPAFLGEHDFAALATLPLVYGFARILRGGPRVRTAIAVTAGAVGCVLGAALASLLGLYLGAIVLVVVAARRERLALPRLALVTAVVGIVTAGTLVLRAGDLGFLQAAFGKPESRPGQYAASWSQRLIYTYVGGRVFLAHPLLGTGWYGELPPQTFAPFLPAARRRFSDQPPRYFPPANKPYIPQQTWDEILYELGVVGGLAMLATLTGLVRAALRAAKRAAGIAAAVPAGWLAAAIGALAGEGLFGGTPLAATFWLVAGVVLALSTHAAFAE